MTKVLKVDIGNGHTKVCDGSEKGLRSFHSIIGEITDGNVPSPSQLDANTHVLQVLDSPNKAIAGKTFIVGQEAEDYCRSIRSVVKDNKAELAPILILASVNPAEGKGAQVNYSQVITSVPDPKQLQSQIVANTKGTHRIVLDGVGITVNILAVDVRGEGSGAFAQAVRTAQLKTDSFNCLIDIGMGTCIVTLWNNKGIELTRKPIENQGVIKLINLIQDDAEMRQLVGGVPNGLAVQRAIEDNSLLYSAEGIDFRHIYDRHRKAWLRENLSEAKSTLAQWSNKIGGYAFTGGGSNIISDLITALNKSSMKVLDNAQFANVIGLGEEAKRVEPESTRKAKKEFATSVV